MKQTTGLVSQVLFFFINPGVIQTWAIFFQYENQKQPSSLATKDGHIIRIETK